MPRFWLSAFVAFMALLGAPGVHAQDSAESTDSAERQQMQEKLRALHWVVGPTKVTVAGNSSLQVPEGYAFLDAADTAKFEELTHNLAGGTEVLITPRSNSWTAYLEFSDAGLVKDDEKIDADAILGRLKRANADANEERRRRGWETMDVSGWALPPAYNNQTKRLEWATLLNSGGYTNINFTTKILGRRGYTTVILAADPAEQNKAIQELNQILGGYTFESGERYADWVPGDRVAEIGLTGLIVGGAAVAAAKAGLFKGLIAALIAGWKFVVAGVLAVVAFLRNLISRRKQPGTP